MKRLILTTAMLMGIGVGGGALLAAETAPAPKAAPPPAHVHGNASAPGNMGTMGGGMGTMGGGMGMSGGGMGMMGGGMGMTGGGFCPMGLGGPDTKVEVKNVDKGVTITFTSTDKTRVARLQKMAEAMRLMHEATAP